MVRLEYGTCKLQPHKHLTFARRGLRVLDDSACVHTYMCTRIANVCGYCRRRALYITIAPQVSHVYQYVYTVPYSKHRLQGLRGHHTSGTRIQAVWDDPCYFCTGCCVCVCVCRCGFNAFDQFLKEVMSSSTYTMHKTCVVNLVSLDALLKHGASPVV